MTFYFLPNLAKGEHGEKMDRKRGFAVWSAIKPLFEDNNHVFYSVYACYIHMMSDDAILIFADYLFIVNAWGSYKI